MQIIVPALIAVGTLSLVRAAPEAIRSVRDLVAETPSVDLECGPSRTGTSGVVTVDLLDSASTHRALTLTTRKAGVVTVDLLDSASIHRTLTLTTGKPGRSTAAGWIGVTANVNGRTLDCEAAAPNQFHVRTTDAGLAGLTLRVTARSPVPVEVRDVHGTVLAAALVGATARERNVLR